ncbi:MAG: DUF1194 domain-containing protein [Pseudomonadota bacterium]
MRFFILIVLWLFTPLAALADDIEVDVELFLAVDVSRSMTPAELEIQRRGYAEALESPDVLAAIQDGLLGRVAVTYVEWAGPQAHRVVVPWRILSTGEDAQTIAQIIRSNPLSGMRRTSISGAIEYAMPDFSDNGFVGLRRVIDISGDGPNNQGTSVEEARDAAIAAGFIINGLPLMTTDALNRFWGIEDLDVYYTRCVIGGPGAFVLPVWGWDAFAPAVKRKLILEISAAPATVIPVQFTQPEPYDCLVGEKLRERYRHYFELP